MICNILHIKFVYQQKNIINYKNIIVFLEDPKLN